MCRIKRANLAKNSSNASKALSESIIRPPRVNGMPTGSVVIPAAADGLRRGYDYRRRLYDNPSKESVRTQPPMIECSTLTNSSSHQPDESISRLIELARGKRRIAVFTGAGISTESGIPDYRGPNGVWATGTPPTLGDFRSNPETRRAYWHARKVRFPELIAHRPNAGHLAIARLYAAGLAPAVITQNIDGLHQDAGIPDDAVIELHGSARRVQCLDCGEVWDGMLVQRRQERGDDVPNCLVCGGPLRAQTVLFGEPLPSAALEQAMALARTCDLMLVVGSSLVVRPAATVPVVAVRAGVPMAIVNLSETPIDHMATHLVRHQTGKVLHELANALLAVQTAG